jgi:succinate dehydrogenase/fumarate reductase iron-sulfur protein
MRKGTVRVKILRLDPEKDSLPSYKTYEMSIEEKTTVLQVLNSIYEDQDRTLAFRRYCCGYKFCNSCMMTINNKAALACHTFVEPEEEITVAPLSDYPVIRDLVVDFGSAISRGRG